MSHNCSAAGFFIDRQQTELPGHNIREHLRRWKAAGDVTSNFVPSLNGDIRPRPSMTVDAILLPGQDGKSYNPLEPDIDIDEGFHYQTTPAQNIMDAITPQLFLRRGDLVLVNDHGTSLIAIMVAEASGTLILYTERGTWHTDHPKGIKFSVPNLCNAHDVSSLLQYVKAFIEDDNTVNEHQSIPAAPRDAGSAVAKKMARFLRESDTVFRNYAYRLARAYEILKTEESGDHTSITLKDAAMRLLEKKDASDITPAMLFIVHRTLKSSQNIIENSYYHRMKPVYHLLPQLSQVRLEVVKEWIRDFQEEKMGALTEPISRSSDPLTGHSVNPLVRFSAKVRRICSRSRQSRPLSPLGTLGPSMAQEMLHSEEMITSIANGKCQETFDQEEQDIIGFLAAWSLYHHLNKTSNLQSLGSTILRATGMYQGMFLDLYAGRTLLQELGIAKPWERAKLFDSFSQLPGNDLQDPATFLLNQAHQWISHSSFSLQDSMSEYRKSWGDTRVLCIDSRGTQEVDDGISLESVDDNEDSCWIHIHVANPSAYLSRDSPVARYARHIGSSAYFPEKKYSMMETELTRKYFSLANGRPCVTFSAKVSAEGDVVEKNVSHGILNNVHHVTWQSVAQSLQDNEVKVMGEDEVSLLKVGADPPPVDFHDSSPEMEGNAAKLDSTNIDILKRLHKVSKALERKRSANRPVPQTNFERDGVIPKVSLPWSFPSSTSGEGGRVPNINAQRSQHFVGDPLISIVTRSSNIFESKEMVAEFMLLAGQICATWCSERNIPIPYRGMVFPPDNSLDPEISRKQVSDLTKKAQLGHRLRTWEHRILFGVSHCSASPMEHRSIGLPLYCKITSPLRRYGDLFIHWQIEAAIRHECSSRHSLVGSNSDLSMNNVILPFSFREVEEVARSIFIREKQVVGFSRNAGDHWIVQALYRAFYFKEAALPVNFEVSVRVVPEDCRQLPVGFLTRLGLKAKLSRTTASDQEDGFQVDDIWEAKLVSVHPFSLKVMLEPLRLIHRMRGST